MFIRDRTNWVSRQIRFDRLLPNFGKLLPSRFMGMNFIEPIVAASSFTCNRRGQRTASWNQNEVVSRVSPCLLYTSPSPRDRTRSRMPSSAWKKKKNKQRKKKKTKKRKKKKKEIYNWWYQITPKLYSKKHNRRDILTHWLYCHKDT